MKILFISSALPHAGVTGGHVIVRERIRRLAARGHQIGLASFATEEEMRHAAEVKAHLVELETRPLPPRVGLLERGLRFACTSLPPYYADYRDRAMLQRVGDMVENGRYDCAVAEFSAMGQYLYRNPWLPAVRKIVSCHFSVAASYRKIATTLPFSVKGLRSRVNVSGLQRYEIDMFRAMDRVLVLTAQERFGILHHEPALRLSVIPAGVDTVRFRPDPEPVTSEEILFTGHYGNLANVDAVMWFAHRVWPVLCRRHPGLVLRIVGPDAPAVMRELPRHDRNIVVDGEVEDIRGPLRRARIFVCPVRLGSGLRVKILEAMAMGLPVVTTTLGGEGMPLHSGENCFIADQPQLMADYIDLLLTDDELRRAMGQKARMLAEERFSWDRSIEMLEDALQTPR